MFYLFLNSGYSTVELRQAWSWKRFPIWTKVVLCDLKTRVVGIYLITYNRGV
jgi:hypothetical protein